jgi:hypothetical protein
VIAALGVVLDDLRIFERQGFAVHRPLGDRFLSGVPKLCADSSTVA